MDVSRAQSRNTESSIRVTESGMVIDFKFLQSAKAEDLIRVTESGIMTDVSLTQ